MSSLTETAFYARRTVNWIILGLIAYIILRILWSILLTLVLIIFPPKPLPPNHGFGRLPAIVFPNQETPPNGKLTFRLETIQGAVPQASESAAVYFMPKKPANLLALNRTQTFAGKLNFDSTPIQENKNTYRFNDPEFAKRTLSYDIVTDNFLARYAYEEDLGLFSNRNIPTEASAIQQARSMLQTYGLYREDIAGGKTIVIPLKLTGSKLVATTSISQADAVRVDFIRRPIGNIPVVTPYTDDGPISFIFSGSENAKKRLLQLVYTYWPVDYQTLATYALKPSTQAWTQLQNGQGYIARFPQKGSVALIRNIYLAYYDSFDPQSYLQPVFVFEGDDGFVGYVPAVAPPWTE